ncbi:Ig-like domain-containing protein [Leucobacter salsicius]|uniref:Ig-like domain-containing protein n=1 Tax=Leucobacter salsicius TaxID=664638 RepID=UPI00034C7B20|nr:Ig-like domain-containing protein [Leucobacter salsicius]
MAGQTKRSRLITWVSGVAALAMIGTIAVVAAGYDAREAPREEPSVWAMRSSGQYARVNTLTAEIDTVRSVDDPSGIVQAGAAGVVLSHGNGRAWPIDAMLPQDLVENAGGEGEAGAESAKDKQTPKAKNDKPTEGAEVETVANPTEGASGVQADRMPDGTRDVISAGKQLLVRTESGEVYVGELTDETGTAGVDLSLIDPFAGETETGEEPRKFVADAAAIDAEGRVAVLSAAAQELRWYSIERAEFVGVEQIPEDITPDDLQLTIVDGSWAALNGPNLWRSGSSKAVSLPLDATPKLQASSLKSEGSGVLVADGEGLWRVTGDEATRIVQASGTAAQPVSVGNKQYAAWVSTAGASMWRGGDEVLELDVDTSVKMPGDPDLVFRTNGSTALLSEVKTGMLWTVPEGRLIPVEQWTLANPPKERDGTVVVADVTEQEPPVAVDDDFGVRANEPAPLPVLLNDYDPNRKDVLTIDPEGLGSDLSAKFGAVSMMPDGQTIAFTPAKGATGSATFSYRISDGVNTSDPAQVKLTVIADTVNTAPAWCPVEGCQRPWPSPELAPGGTLVLPILEGWVDPEGDPIMLSSATPVDAEDPVRALVTADGRLAVRHLDPNANGGEVAVRVRVEDAHGKASDRDLVVQVRSNAKAELSPIATTVEVGQSVTVRPLARVTGGSGSYTLVDASVQNGTAQVSMGAGGAVSVRAEQAGQTLVALTVRDSGTKQETTGLMRVSAVPSHAKLALPPLRAFVRPLADTTVDVLDAVPGANSRALVVQGAQTVDGELRADVIEYANVRVSGSTPDGAPGRIGAVDVTVAEGADTAVGRMTVFQVPEQTDTGAIAVADNATVRAGAVADISVLDNDVSSPGQRLVLHPEISGSGTKGELAFASGNTLRYLAPKEPGQYTLSYTTYGASSPEASDVGQVHVTVLPSDGNRDPSPTSLTVRMAPGETSNVVVPLSGVDPDGDRVRLVSVDAPGNAQLTATIVPRSSAISVEASTKAKAGVQTVKYTVRDDFGGEGQGSLRIIVTDSARSTGAPITYSDYVRLVQGAKDPAVVSPLENDLDPTGGELSIVEVVPNVPGGEDSAEYRALKARLDTSEIKKGRIKVKSSPEPGTVSYRYTVRSSESSSTADGLIVVQVSARVGQQAPTVRDTVLSARDRAELESGGVDVVTDRVYWATGDAAALKLSVWGSAAKRFEVNGKKISGKYRAEGDMVPFKLAGTDVTGKKVESFGFLVIPPLDELRLTLVPALAPLKVDEGKSRDAALTDLIDLGPNDHAEFKTGGFPTQRGQAVCSASSKTSLSYNAGKGEPWVDTCLVSVKLTEQKAWTLLSVPVQIVPKEPVAELEPLTRTIAPGASETINLVDMVQWQGQRNGRPGDLQFAVAGGGANFEISPGGSQVTVTARADALPGAEDPATVTVTGAGESQAPLTLRVGQAAKDTPRGATVQLACTVGSACQTQLIGAPGEYDPFQGKSGGGLKVESIDGSSCAAYGTMAVAGDGVNVAWPNGAKGAGGKCTASYTVRDAQKRVGTGTIELDARGVPRPPVGVTPVDAGSSSVKLSVALSTETSHPATTGVELVTEGGGSVGSCSLEGGQASCTVSGLTPGDKRTYFARAVNEVGDSDQSANGAETWAYSPPKPPTIESATVPWGDNTDSGTGKVRVKIGASSAAGNVLSIDGGEVPIATDGIYTLPTRNHTFSVISVDDATLIPPAYSGGDGGRGTSNSTAVTPIGAPSTGSASLAVTGNDNTGWEFQTSGWNSASSDPVKLSYGLGPAGSGVGCTGSSETGTGLKPNLSFEGAVCASNDYGRAGPVTTGAITTGKQLPAINGTYTVEQKGTLNGSSYVWNAGKINWTPEPTGDVSPFTIAPGSPTATVKQCPSGLAGHQNCSDDGTVRPAVGSLEPFSISRNPGSCVAWVSDTEPPSESSLAAVFSTVGAPGGQLSFTQDQDALKDVIVSWPSGARDSVSFAGVICERPDPPATGTDADANASADGASESAAVGNTSGGSLPGSAAGGSGTAGP